MVEPTDDHMMRRNVPDEYYTYVAHEINPLTFHHARTDTTMWKRVRLYVRLKAAMDAILKRTTMRKIRRLLQLVVKHDIINQAPFSFLASTKVQYSMLQSLKLKQCKGNDAKMDEITKARRVTRKTGKGPSLHCGEGVK